jgi:4-hydroxysphinganine ceramide fatty acyl 2-hydroxylase
MKKTFVSNSQEPVRMFKSDFLESLSRVHWSVPIFIFIPVTAFCIYMSLGYYAIGFVNFIELFFGGLFIWTFVEYVLHRFVFHYIPADKPWAMRLHFICHGVHHDFPSDRKRLVLPPSMSVPLSIGFFFLYRLIFPLNYNFAFYSGFILGYLIYDIMHYALHHFNFKGGFWKKLKHHHMLHHYQDPEKGYGVSSAFWDKIFMSDFGKKKKTDEPATS